MLTAIELGPELAMGAALGGCDKQAVVLALDLRKRIAERFQDFSLAALIVVTAVARNLTRPAQLGKASESRDGRNQKSSGALSSTSFMTKKVRV
jgi:hypothetical protein